MGYKAGQKLRASDLGSADTSAEYNATSDQTITTSTDTKIAFGTTNSSSTYVTRAVDGVGHSFTLNRDGLWAITTGILWEALTTNERWTRIWVNGAPIVQIADIAASANFISQNGHITRPFTNGDVIHIVGWQNKGSSVLSKADNTNAYGRINLCWLGG